MREREPGTEEADVVEIADDAAQMSFVGPFALVARFQQVHVNAPAGPCRRGGNGGEQFGRAPLHPLRAVLHVEHRASCG